MAARPHDALQRLLVRGSLHAVAANSDGTFRRLGWRELVLSPRLAWHMVRLRLRWAMRGAFGRFDG